MNFGFIDAIKGQKKNAIIGEVKAFSPILGDLIRGRNAVEIVKTYEAAGCSAISYITAKEFGGNLKTLEEICKATRLPVLRKDFIKSSKEVEITSNTGASALLLIARNLKERTAELVDRCFEHNIEPVVEVFSEEDLNYVENARVVLINNRDIFQPSDVDLKRTFHLAPKIKKLKISGSGIKSPKDLIVLRSVDAALVGTAFMLAENTFDFVKSFVEAKV